ncbi:MAG: phosphotransferase [Elusimicrobia bacterium]|nr:phosphotransferase [Elusimicrobiota bacterium]
MPRVFEGNLAPFETFYQEAKTRDRTMVRQLIVGMGELPKNRKAVAVLVAGGFHGDGVIRRLTEKGVTVVSFTPKVTKADTEGAGSLSIFTQEKTPLEKLFLGEKLTLAQPPLFPEARSRIGFMAWARALWLGKGTLSSEVLTDLEKLRASPELAVKQLRYENGVLFLEMNGREVPVISQEGNLTVDIESEIDRSPLPPLSKRLQAVATEFVYFASARVSHQLTRFVFQSHRVGNKNMHVLALRLLGIERIIQATDVGFLFGIVFGVSFGWWWFPLTWFSVYAVTHLAQQHLFPNAPAMADPPESNPLALLTEKGRSLVEAGELAEASRVFQQVRDQFLELSAHNGNGRLTGRELSLWIKQTGTSDVFNVEELQEILAQHPIELPDVGRFLLASLYLSSGYYQRAGPQSFEDQESSEQKPREALPLRSQLITVGPLHENGFMRTGSTPYLYKSQDQKKKFVVKYLGARSLPEMLSLKVFQYLGFNVEDTGVPPGETGYVITSWVDGTMNVSEYIRSTLISPVYFRPSAIGEKIFPSSIRNILEGSKLAAMIVDLTDFNLGNVLLHVNEKGEILPRRPVFIDFEKSFYFMTNSETGFGVMEKRYRNGFSRDDFFGGWDTNRLMREPLFHRNALIENMRWLYPAVASLSKEDIKRFVSEAVASVAPLTPLGKLGDDQEGLESKLWEGVQSALELYQLDVGEGGLAKQIKGKRFASIGNERALIKWGWDNLSYGAYTVRQAPLWEVIYQIPGLPQRVVQVLSDWFVRRLVGEDEKSGEPVVAEVRHQNAITLMGTLVLITGLIGGGGWIIPGTIIWALMSGYVFSESHRGRTTSEKRQILFVGFVLALSFLGPSLVLFWLDPIGFGWGLKALAYAGGLLFGYGLNVGIHSIYNVTALSHGWATATLAEKGKGPFDKEATKSFAVKIGDMVVLHKLVTKYIQNAQKTLKSGMDGKPFSAELAERSRSIRGELLVLARKTSPHFAELYKDIHNDQLDDIYALSGFLRNVFLFIYIPMGWAMGVVGKTGQVPMIDREGWQRLSYMGGTLWVGWASSGVSEKLMTTGVSSIELPGFVFVDPVGTKAYALSVWRDIAKFTHKSVLEQKWVALFKESHSTPIGFVEAILEKLIRDRLAYSKLSLYASRKMKIPLEKLTEEDIVKAVVSPSWKWREELRPLLGEFDIDLEDEDLSFLLDGVAHEILSILDSHIELMRFMVSHETKIESKEGDGALLNSNRKKFIFGVAVWNIVEMMRTAQTGLSGHPRRVMASKFLINAMADELGIPKGPSQETEHDARRESLLLQNLLQERGTDLDRFLSTLVSIRDRLMLSPEERFNHLNARVPTLDEIDELYTNIPLGKGRLHLKNGVTGVKKPLARFRQSVNPKTRLLLERAKIVLSTLGHEEEIRAAEFVKRLYSLADGLDHLVMDYSPDRLKAFTGEMVRLREESSKHADNKEVGDIMGLVESIYGDTVMAIFHNRLEETQSHINPEDVRGAIQELLNLEADRDLLNALPAGVVIELDEYLSSARSLLATQGPFTITDILENATLFGLEEQEVDMLRRRSETDWLDTDRAIMENLKEKLGKSFPDTLSDALALWVLPGKSPEKSLGYELYLSPEVSETQWNEHGSRVMESIRRLRAGLSSGLMPGSWVELKPQYPRVYRGRLGDSRVYVRFLPHTTGRPDMIMAVLALGPKSNFTNDETHGSISSHKIGDFLSGFVFPENFQDSVFRRFSWKASDSRGGLDSTHDAQPASLGYWIAKRLGLNEQRSRSLGFWGLLLEIPFLVGLRALGEAPGPMGTDVFAFLGMEPVSVSLLLIVFYLMAGLHFVSARKVNNNAGRDPPSRSYLWKTFGVFSLYLLPGSVIPAILVHLVIDFYDLFFFRSETEFHRNIAAPDISTKGERRQLVPLQSKDKGKEIFSALVIVEKPGGKWLVSQNHEGQLEFPRVEVERGGANSTTISESLSEDYGLVVDSEEIASVGSKDPDNYRPVFAYRREIPGASPEKHSVTVAYVGVKGDRLSSLPKNGRFRWVSPHTIRKNLNDYALNTRMGFLLALLETEYGMLDVLAVDPLLDISYSRSIGPPLMVTTDKGKFILHRAGEEVRQARFGVAWQQHLFENGIPVPKIQERLAKRRDNDPTLLLLSGQHFILESLLENGTHVKENEATVDHYYSLGQMIGRIQNVSASFALPSNLKRVEPEDPRLGPLVPLHNDLHRGNVFFASDGKVTGVLDFEHCTIGPRVNDILVALYGIRDIRFIRSLIKGFNETVSNPLTEVELQRIARAVHVRADQLMEQDISVLSFETPSTLAWFWSRMPWSQGPLDNMLRKAPWETVPFVVSIGLAVGANLLYGTSLWWVASVSLLAGLLGYFHRAGTYGFKGASLVSVAATGAESVGKAFVWFLKMGAWGGFLFGVAQAVPTEFVPAMIGFATWAGASLDLKLHRRENQNWLAAHLSGLTEPQREIARDVLKNLEGRPITLGVGELRELVIKRAEVYAEGRHGVSVPSTVPEASSGESQNLVILPQGDLSPEGLHNLKKWMEKDATLVLVTDVSQESLPAGQVIVVPKAFRTLGQQAPIQEVDLALVREALDGLGLVARGVPFRLYHAAALRLDESNLGEGDPFRQAAQNALVILLEHMKAFPVGITGWNDILAVFQALAQAA